MFRLPSGEVVAPTQAFTLEEVQYISGVARLTHDERDKLGITEVTPVPRADDRYYFNNSDGTSSPKPVKQIVPSKIGDIKGAANALILSRFNIYKQLNMLMRGNELNALRVANGSWTAAEIAEVVTLQGNADWITAVRDHSNALEAEVSSLDFDALVAWQQHGWPEIP